MRPLRGEETQFRLNKLFLHIRSRRRLLLLLRLGDKLRVYSKATKAAAAVDVVVVNSGWRKSYFRNDLTRQSPPFAK